MNQEFQTYIAAELARSQPVAIQQAAKEIMGHYGDHAVACLFYGSCLRTGEVEDKILDFYIIVDDYLAAYGSRALAWGNKMIPPNVFYHETSVDGVTVRSKYAVVSQADFCQRCTEQSLNISIWARFSQPSVLMFAQDEGVTDTLTTAIMDAIKTMMINALPYVAPDKRQDSHALWTTAFDLTYSAELRSEKKGKGEELYALDQARYDALTPLVLSDLSEGEKQRQKTKVSRRWFWRRINGKFVSVARLIKASFTFSGGIDYLAWKISRHSGVAIEVKPWHRKHPIIAGLYMLLVLKKKGAIR